MKKSDLKERLSQLGFPLLEVAKEVDANLTLADLVKLQDFRLWEGFPQVLAFSAGMGKFDYNKAKEYLTSHSDKLHFDLLLAMSFALYKAFKLKFAWAAQLYQLFNETNKKQCELYFKAFKNDQDLRLGKYFLSSQRLKTTFNNYFRNRQQSLRELLSLKEEYGLEFALSEVFSPKQKELFLKKLRNEKLTKTEKEYFSRVVKKKVFALANPELHRLSQRLLE